MCLSSNLEEQIFNNLFKSYLNWKWKYHTGNSWGVSATGPGCLGCGDVQEEFYGCSDVTITNNGSSVVTSSPLTSTPVSLTTSRESSTTTQVPIITTTRFIESGNNKCFNGDGYYADVSSGCQNYYVCQFTGTQYTTIINHSCPTGLRHI
jgi:hypothetical protein